MAATVASRRRGWNHRVPWESMRRTTTAMAGIAAAESNNEIGIAGIGWHSTIMPLKVSGPRVRSGKVIGVSGNLVNVTRAICYAANNGADVIVTLAAGLPLPDENVDKLLDMRQAIQFAADAAP